MFVISCEYNGKPHYWTKHDLWVSSIGNARTFTSKEEAQNFKDIVIVEDFEVEVVKVLNF